MDCTSFVARFTDYLDGLLSPAEERAVEEHLGRCGSCMRYKNVVEHGRSVLLSLPVPELRADFGSRLEHRLLHVAEERDLPDDVASRAPALAVLGIAVLLTAIAWSPLLRGPDPVVQLQPIVVDHAPAPPRRSPAAFSALSNNGAEDLRLPVLDSRLWEDMRLYEFSPLSRRYPQTLARQVGFGTER